MNIKKVAIILCVICVLGVPVLSRKAKPKSDRGKEGKATEKRVESEETGSENKEVKLDVKESKVEVKIEEDGDEEEKKVSSNYKFVKSDEDKDRVRYVKKKEKPVEYVVTEEVYLDIECSNYFGYEDALVGRMVIAVFGDIVPMTALNFISLAKGFKKRGVLYKYAGTLFHRVVEDFIIQAGDVTHKNGEGGMSLYGPVFDDENHLISHHAPGIVSMANYGRNSNGSQFFILLQKSRWLNKKHVAFGKVIKGMHLVKKLGSMKATDHGTMYKTVRITDSGVVGISSKYELTAEQMESEKDLD